MSYESLPFCGGGLTAQGVKMVEDTSGTSADSVEALKTFKCFKEWTFWRAPLLQPSFFAPLDWYFARDFYQPIHGELTDLPRNRDCRRRAKVFVWALWVGNQQSKTFAGPKKVFEMKLDQFKILQNHQFSWSKKTSADLWNLIGFFWQHDIDMKKNRHVWISMWNPSQKWWAWTTAHCRSICCNPCLLIIECTSMNSSRWAVQRCLLR